METKLERKLIQHIFIENISQPMTSAYKEVIVLVGVKRKKRKQELKSKVADSIGQLKKISFLMRLD
jgi:hypothetical protein